MFYLARHKVSGFLFIFFVLVSVSVSAQNDSRLSFWRYGLFYETGKNKPENFPSSGFGNAAGLEINVNPVYNGLDGGDKFNLGWSLNLAMGWNFSGAHLAPYRFDMGFWGGYVINDDIEIGGQYCFLGAYAYQRGSHLGSSLSGAVKWKNIQLTITRAGQGAIRGCFAPKNPDNFSAQHSFEAAYFLGKIMVGARTNYYRFGTGNSSEFRFFVAKNIGESK